MEKETLSKPQAFASSLSCLDYYCRPGLEPSTASHLSPGPWLVLSPCRVLQVGSAALPLQKGGKPPCALLNQKWHIWEMGFKNTTLH